MSYLDLLQYHAFCLTNSGTRLSEYERAIAASVRQGDVVLDLGTGSGMLAVLACRAGARRVYAIEASDAFQLGKLLTSTTEFAGRIEFIHGTSQQVTPSEAIDVIVCDIHDTFGLQPGGLASLCDARDRLLKLGGVLVPRATELMIAPVEATAFYTREIDAWAQRVHGVDLAPARPLAVSHVHAGRFDEEQLLSAPSAIGVIDFRHASSLYFCGSTTTTITRDGLTHGLCGCFVTTLADDICMGNVPGDSGRTNFAQAFFPLEQPVTVAAGDVVSIRIENYDGHVFRWRVAFARAGLAPYAQFDHSTLGGLLASPASAALRLRRREPSDQSMLEPSGEGTIGPSDQGTIAPSHSRTVAPLQSMLPSSSMPDVSGRLRVHPSVLSRELAGETVLLNLESGVYYGLDAVGTRAWNLLTEERTFDDVCTIMLEEFDVSRDTLRGDLTALVRELCEKQLLVAVPSTSTS